MIFFTVQFEKGFVEIQVHRCCGVSTSSSSMPCKCSRPHPCLSLPQWRAHLQFDLSWAGWFMSKKNRRMSIENWIIRTRIDRVHIVRLFWVYDWFTHTESEDVEVMSTKFETTTSTWTLWVQNLHNHLSFKRWIPSPFYLQNFVSVLALSAWPIVLCRAPGFATIFLPKRGPKHSKTRCTFAVVYTKPFGVAWEFLWSYLVKNHFQVNLGCKRFSRKLAMLAGVPLALARNMFGPLAQWKNPLWSSLRICNSQDLQAWKTSTYPRLWVSFHNLSCWSHLCLCTCTNCTVLH